ncbi:MAG: CPBP family intramembrane metalloprotease [Prevotella sp.]|nr:CPBP family intramembrane metalloprotease [Alistipes senegalensis]MCM1357065.1 CPBP family intramembrane metalloprotease [Prevotella sp.]MCM1473096.1 CPBP family intramembrane metalloprotease [Muribaculaceae bacterium]
MSKITKYLLFTFITSWTFQIIGSHDFNLESIAGMTSFSQSVALCMLMPTFGAFFAKADIRNMGWKLNFEDNKKLILFAWLMPTVFEIAGATFYYIMFPEDFDTSGAILKDIDPSAFAELEKTGSSYGAYIAKEIFYSLTSFYTFVAVFMGLGEEIGWRGFLFPELKKSLGRTKGVLIGGVIHGVWHFPLMLFVGYEYGKDYIGAPLLGLFTFCIFTVTTGIISDYLYEKSYSIWLPAIFHGLINSTINPCLLRGNEHTERSIFGPVSIGLISVMPMALFAAGILYIDFRSTDSISETDFLD